MDEAKELEDPGKIYFYNNYIFINEKRAGVHVFDNSTPSSPQNIGFLNIPGNVDIAIRNDIMLADNYIDLLWSKERKTFFLLMEILRKAS